MLVQRIQEKIMKSVTISELRANLLQYLERANAGEVFSVTTNGRLIATIAAPVNLKQEARKELHQIAEEAEIYDVTSPIDTSWNES